MGDCQDLGDGEEDLVVVNLAPHTHTHTHTVAIISINKSKQKRIEIFGSKTQSTFVDITDTG